MRKLKLILITSIMTFSLVACTVIEVTEPEKTPTNTNDTAVTSTSSPTSAPKEESTSTPTPTIKEEPTTTPIPEVTRYKSGQYKVGEDIPAGEYVVFADGFFGGYAERAKDSSGDLDSIITNNTVDTNIIITVKDGEYFNISDAYAMAIDDVPVLDTTTGGMFKVGTHLKAGEYKIQIDEDNAIDYGYIEVATDSSGELDSIRTNDTLESSMYITVKDGEYLTLVGCHIVKNKRKK